MLEDNTRVEHLLRHFSSRVPALQQELRRLSAILTQNNITLETVRVASAENPADAPSRYASTLRVILSDVAFCRVESLHGPHTIDRFASWDTARCALFNCGHGDAHALVPVIHAASDLPNDVLLSALSAAVGAARTCTASYDWSPDEYVCYIYYE